MKKSIHLSISRPEFYTLCWTKAAQYVFCFMQLPVTQKHPLLSSQHMKTTSARANLAKFAKDRTCKEARPANGEEGRKGGLDVTYAMRCCNQKKKSLKRQSWGRGQGGVGGGQWIENSLLGKETQSATLLGELNADKVDTFFYHSWSSIEQTWT